MAKSNNNKADKPDTAENQTAPAPTPEAPLEQEKAPETENRSAPPAEQATPETPAPEQPGTETTPPPAPAQAAPEAAPELFSLSELAARHRLASWHSAALHKMMAWEPGKRVSDAEYAKALASLKNRRLGG